MQQGLANHQSTTMGKHQYYLLTGDHCVLCLRRGSWSPTTQNMSNMICQYLKVDLREAVAKTVLSVDSLLKLDAGVDESELMGSLCPKCTQLSERFSAHFLEMEEIRLKLEFCLKEIYDRMVEVDNKTDGGVLRVFRREMLRRPETLCQLGVVEHLRKKTLDRCSRKLATAAPRVNIERLSDAVLLVTTGVNVEDRSDPLTGGTYTNDDSGDVDMLVDGGERDEAPIIEHGLSPKPSPLPSKKIAQVGSHNDLQCPICRKVFFSKPNLTVHLKTIHLNLREHECQLCDSRFTQKAHLAKHRRLVHPSVQSHGSKKAGGSKSKKLKLVSHKRKHISKFGKGQLTPKPDAKLFYRCLGCDKAFAEEHLLKCHFEEVHLKPSKFACPKCGKGFNKSSNLQLHTKTVHFELRPFRCDCCEKRFKQKAHLAKHVRLLHRPKKKLKTSTPTAPKSKSKMRESLKLENHQSATEEEEDGSPSLGVTTSLTVGFPVPPTIDVNEHVQSTSRNQNELASVDWISIMKEGDDDDDGDVPQVMGTCETKTDEPKQENVSFQDGIGLED